MPMENAIGETGEGPTYIDGGVAFYVHNNEQQQLLPRESWSGLTAEAWMEPLPAFLVKFPRQAYVVADTGTPAPFARIADFPGWEDLVPALRPDGLQRAFAAAAQGGGEPGTILVAPTTLRLETFENLHAKHGPDYMMRWKLPYPPEFDGYFSENDGIVKDTEAYFRLCKRICFGAPDAG